MKYATIFEKYRDSGLLERVKQYSKWTIPSVAEVDIHKMSPNSSMEVAGDYQSDGATLVSTLSSKLSGLLFPTTHPFLRIPLEKEVKEAIATYTEFDLEQVEDDCARIENEACSRLFLNSSYSQIIASLNHLIITGNVCIYRDSNTSRLIAYGLNSYVTRRDALGRVTDAVIKERVTFGDLPETLKYHLIEEHGSKYKEEDIVEKYLDLYTRIKLTTMGESRGYQITQELDGDRLPIEGWYRENRCPYIFPVWDYISGENYGRGLVEKHAGSFATVSELSEALLLYKIESLRLINVAAPGGASDIDELVTADVGEWVQGDPNSLSVLETRVVGKVAETQAMIQSVLEKLARAFMYAGPTRQGERVTAYEIQQQAIEADNALGGPYSTLSDTLQLPLAYLLIQEVDPYLLDMLSEVQGREVTITTGIDALGRSTKVQNLLAAVNEVAAMAQLLPADNRLDATKVYDAVYRGRSIDTSEYMKSPEQLQAEQEAEAEMGAAQMEGQQAVNMAEQAKAMEQLQIG